MRDVVTVQQLDADQASAFSKQSDLKGTSIELQVKETLQLTCIINVKPGDFPFHDSMLCWQLLC